MWQWLLAQKPEDRYFSVMSKDMDLIFTGFNICMVSNNNELCNNLSIMGVVMFYNSFFNKRITDDLHDFSMHWK